MSEVGRKDLSACFFEITYMGIEVVCVSVEVPNPGCGFGAFGKLGREEPRFSEFLIVDWIDISVDRLVIRSRDS
jgi:hypothetical protein